MDMNSGNTVAATAVWAMMWVRATSTKKQPRRIMLVFSPTMPSMV